MINPLQNHLFSLKIFLLVVLTLLGACRRNILNPNADKDGIKRYQIRPDRTAEEIFQFNEPHRAYISTTASLRDRLLVFLGATDSRPRYYEQFCHFAARQGYHVVNISYASRPSSRVCSPEKTEICFDDFHLESYYGINVSPYVFINATHSIQNRIIKLIQFLDEREPDENWGQFLDGADLAYIKTVFSGHGVGAGHAAYIGKEKELARVLMFSGPNDYSDYYEGPAAWTDSTFKTPVIRFYGLLHLQDELYDDNFSRQYAFWEKIGLADTVNIDGKLAPFQSARALYTNTEPDRSNSLAKYHNSTVSDKETPKEGDQLLFEPVWEYMLE